MEIMVSGAFSTGRPNFMRMRSWNRALIMSDSAQSLTYRTSELERARTADLLRIVPKDRRSVLDIGARDGFFSALLREHFDQVTALDLRMPLSD